MTLPEKFTERIKNQMTKDDFNSFVESLESTPPVSVRVNPRKLSQWTDNDGKIPWCPTGYYLKERPVFTLDPTFHTGSYYVQEASSMFLWHVLDNLPIDKEEVKILDLSAAPGGKSSLIATWLNGQGLLCANEVIRSRATILKFNIMKEGFKNIVVTQNDPSDFKLLTEAFDIILVDAPCSGEGMFRKDPNARNEWSESHVTMCSSRQKRILSDILPALKPDGYLIYSTCTFNDDENINNVHWMAEELGLIGVNIGVPAEWNIETINKNDASGYQFHPHKIRGEGFFISVLQNQHEEKNDRKISIDNKTLHRVDKKLVPEIMTWINDKESVFLMDKTGDIHAIDSRLEGFIYQLNKHLRIIYCGVTIGNLNRNLIIPDYSLALSYILSEDTPKIELSLNDALRYLKRDSFSLESSIKGWMVPTYQGNGLGWIKNLGNRFNNYLPKENRIRMDIPTDSDQ